MIYKNKDGTSIIINTYEEKFLKLTINDTFNCNNEKCYQMICNFQDSYFSKVDLIEFAHFILETFDKKSNLFHTK